MLSTYEDFIAWGLLVLPLIALAWAAVRFVLIEGERARHERYKRFHTIMEQLARSDGPTADKMAAAYELRRYREYAQIIEKVFAEGKVKPATAEALQAQLKDSLEYVKK